MINKNKLVYNWGINDSPYNVYKYVNMQGKTQRVWCCPYYMKWRNMLNRCFSAKYQKRQPTYQGCTISDDWRHFSNFIEWVDKQPNRNWVDCQLDKDFLSLGNKHYSPNTVVFIHRKVNSFITDSRSIRGNCMIGVSLSGKNRDYYKSECSNPFTGKGEYLGVFPTELEAHKTWQARKHEHACQLADLQDDPRVEKVLRERYAQDKDWS